MKRLHLILRPLLRRWRVLSLARQYLLAGAAVLVAGMLTIGVWVTNQITKGVTQNTAAATALYVDGVIAPLLPNIDGTSILAEGPRRALDEVLGSGALGKRLETFKLWGKGGLITYSNDPSLIGKRFEPTGSLRQAWAGQVASEFNDLDDDEDATERNAGIPLLEIYNPIREPWSGKIVAVAEFYEHADDLERSLFTAAVRSWIVVAGVTVAMIGALFGIVRGGSGTIDRQRKALEQRVSELQRLLGENKELGRRVREAASRVSALNERTLRQLSADLHDGPAQLLALASLRLGSPALTGAVEESRRPELGSIRGFLDEAMADIRGTCQGLALPNIEALGLTDLLRNVAAAHERKTGTQVILDLPEETISLSPAEKVGVFRFVQEGLNNAFRHADGSGQEVTARIDGRDLIVEVGDKGGGFAPGQALGLGLTGLRDRVESLGGRFEIDSRAQGSRLLMRLFRDGEVLA